MKAQSREILFRCDAGDKVGSGHLIRCLALAEALKKKGFVCFFLCNEQAWRFPALIKSGHQRISEQQLPDHTFAYGVVDHYGLDLRYEAFLRPFCEKILVIDDLANRGHDCDILVDFSPSRKKSDYHELVPAHCEMCLGLAYVILRPGFLSSEAGRGKNKTLENILITMGSVDGGEDLPKILAFLESYQKMIHIHVLLNHKTRTLDKVKEISSTSKHKMTLHIDIDDPSPIMKAVDLAITSGGMTCLELLALQIPSLVMITADNQRENVKYLCSQGYLKHIEDYESLCSINLDSFLSENSFRKLRCPEKLKILDHMP